VLQNSHKSDDSLEKYRNYLLVLARRQMDGRLKAKLDASDIVQQALLNALTAREQFHGESEPERIGWLRAILKNTIAMAGRKFAQSCRDIGLEVSLEKQLAQSSVRLERWLAADASTPSIKLSREEQLWEVLEALSNLPNDQRQAIELHHLQELPFAEVARQMNRTKPSVAGLIFRGMRELRSQLLKSQSEVRPR